jgi:hypothetical protein
MQAQKFYLFFATVFVFFLFLGLQFKGCFVLFCVFLVGFSSRESLLGFAELCFLFSSHSCEKLFCFVLFFQCTESGFAKTLVGRRGRIQDLNKTTLLLLLLLL